MINFNERPFIGNELQYMKEAIDNKKIDKEVIKRDVEIMKKYKLGIFQYNR